MTKQHLFCHISPTLSPSVCQVKLLDWLVIVNPQGDDAPPPKLNYGFGQINGE